jgi:UDP-N-acetyl-2-amino-2-deoxyglucuronate dehydrogenase
MSSKIMDKDESGKSAPKGLDWVNWRSSVAKAGGGVIIDGGQHWLRPLRLFLGDPVEVMGVLGRPLPAIEGESLCHALLKYASGISASFQCTVLGDDGVLSTAEPFFRIIGTTGEIVIRGDFAGGGQVYNADNPDGSELVTAGQGGFIRSYRPQMADFCAACLSGQGSAALKHPGAYAVGELRITLAIYKSAASGRWEPI